MSEWGHGDDDELARRLREALHRDADRVEIPDRYQQLRAAARQPASRRTPWLVAVASALALVVGAGVVWQSGILRGGTVTPAAASAQAPAERGPGAASPKAPSQQSQRGSDASPAATLGSAARTVTGATVGFATPGGDLVCLMTGTEVVCQSLSTTAWEQATPRTCLDTAGASGSFGSDRGGVVLDAAGARLRCDIQGLQRLDLAAADPATNWYQAGRDLTVPTRYGAVPVLPYGGVATTSGGQRCEPAQSGVTCTDPSGAAVQLSRQSVTLAGRRGPSQSVVRYVTVARLAGFVTPTGGIWCGLLGTEARCEVAEPTFAKPAKPDSCRLDWALIIAVDAAGRGFVCGGDPLYPLAEVGNPEWADWFDPRFGSTVSLPSGKQGAVLTYGSTITSGQFTCSVEATGVTCLDTASGRGFAVSKDSYRLLP